MGDPTGLAIHGVDFDAAVETITNAPGLRMSGNADGTIVAPLEMLITTLHRDLGAAGARRVLVDIRGLEFMSASCFNVFVTWLGFILELSPASRYQLVFVANAAIPWQRRSLHTLSCFATDLVAIET